MSKKTPRPATPLAKADAAMTNRNRKTYPGWDEDAARFGIRAADYNAGFVAGSKDAQRKRKG